MKPVTAFLAFRLCALAADSTGARAVTLPRVEIRCGELPVVICLNDGFTDQGSEWLRTGLAWGPVTGLAGNPGEWAARELQTSPLTATTLTIDSPARIVTAPLTDDLVVRWDGRLLPRRKAVAVIALSGLSEPDFWYFYNQPNLEGEGTAVDLAAIVTRLPVSFLVSAVGINGPESDPPGSWSGAVPVARIGADGLTLSVAVTLLTRICTAAARLELAVPRPWISVPVDFGRPREHPEPDDRR